MVTRQSKVTAKLAAVLSGVMVMAVMAAPGVGAEEPLAPSDYSVRGETGSEVYLFGDAAFHGSLEQKELDSYVAGIASHPVSQGYWIATGDGEVHAFGAAAHLSYSDVEEVVMRSGGCGSIRHRGPIVSHSRLSRRSD